MKIQNINPNQNTYNKSNFKGYINGNYYYDDIEIEAKKALKNPNWESNLRRRLTREYRIKHWNEDERVMSKVDRRITAYLTLGFSEIIAMGIVAIDTIWNNNPNETVEKVRRCMADMIKQNARKK